MSHQLTDDLVTIEDQNSTEVRSQIDVFGMNGGKVFSQMFPSDPLKSVQLQLREGNYLAKISGDKEVQTLKLIFR